MKEPMTSEVEVLLAPWKGPCGGAPPFDAASPRTIERAFEIAVGHGVAADEAFRGFRGRDPDTGAPLRRFGMASSR